MAAKDFPWDEIIRAVEQHNKMGHDCFQKFTCAKCKNRLMIEQPNRFHTTASCDKCGHVTDIKKQGCNYMLLMRGPKEETRH